MSLLPGLLTLHSHRVERLLEVVAAWLQRHPLEPLEEEIFIVQSNAVAEWLQMSLARQLGVCAAVRVELPARFVWQLSRQVLGRAAVPAVLPLDELPMAWRLMRHLPQWLAADDEGDSALWQPLRDFLAEDACERLWALCARLADLYDQYQIYRPDWLQAWAQGQTRLTDGRGQSHPLPAAQRWQARLWQRLIESLSPAERATTRAALMAQLLQRLSDPCPIPPEAPRRVIAFGMSHLPPALLQVLAALARHSQVLLAVPNPCQYHWADAIDGRELLRGLARRQALKPGVDLAHVPLEQLHAHTHPLLAAWGRQSRDFIRLLDAAETAASPAGADATASAWPRVDLFIDPADPEDTHPTRLLRQIQNAIRDLQPLHEQRQLPSHRWHPGDRSIVFHSAHSRVRELEVLHDQLLALLGRSHPGQTPAETDLSGGQPLQPRDIVVMVPDMAPWASAIAAVFGQYPPQDPRHIPFDLADLGADAISPLIHAWRWLWRLPQERLGLSEWLSLLEVPALQQRLGLSAPDLPRLAQWLCDAGLRWGLHAAHRAAQGLPTLGDSHTAAFALERMLWGYAVGPADPAAGEDTTPLPAEPLADVAGLDAELAGSMAQLLRALAAWWALCQSEATPAQWVARGQWLLQALFQADLPVPADLGPSPPPPGGPTAALESDADRGAEAPLRRAPLSPAEQAAVDAVLAAGQRWLQASAEAGCEAPLPLGVARAAWEHALRAPQAQARFHAGGLTFCTLLPMRAIPFRVICLLGMNDADYPRRSPTADFDLMARPGMARPGDRSRRDDDRQLMLEALLSARDVLYISWCGRSARDHSPQPPSVLVAQLREHIAQGWGSHVLAQLTTEHPLQPFSPRYWEGHPQLFSHAHEWHRVQLQIKERQTLLEKAPEPEKSIKTVPPPPGPAPEAEAAGCSLSDLARALTHPVRAHLQERLGVWWDDAARPTPDDEPFDLDPLHAHTLRRQLLEPLLDAEPPTLSAAAMARLLGARLLQAQRAGLLPLAAPGRLWQAQWLPGLLAQWQAWQTVRQALPQQPPRLRLDAPAPLADWLDAPTPAHTASPAWAALTAALPALAGAAHVARARSPRRVLAGKGKAADPERLLPVWLRSLSLCSLSLPGAEPHLLWVATDATVCATPQPREQAQATLERLLAHRAAALTEPLPLPLRTALVWLQSPQPPWAKLRQAYEGNDHARGEGQDPYWQRLYPSLPDLLADGRFAALAPLVWEPYLHWLASHASHHPHPEPDVELPPEADPLAAAASSPAA